MTLIKGKVIKVGRFEREHGETVKLRVLLYPSSRKRGAFVNVYLFTSDGEGGIPCHVDDMVVVEGRWEEQSGGQVGLVAKALYVQTFSSWAPRQPDEEGEGSEAEF